MKIPACPACLDLKPAPKLTVVSQRTIFETRIDNGLLSVKQRTPLDGWYARKVEGQCLFTTIFDVDFEAVRDVVTRDLPPLALAMRSILARPDPAGSRPLPFRTDGERKTGFRQ
jgi:hypothetical protein